MECLECKRECATNRSFGIHLRLAHGLTREAYLDKHNLRRCCSKCNAPLRARYKGRGLCKTCADNNRIGANNHFFGKHHDRSMIDATKVKLRAISKELWQGEDYRSKVISGVSKPRRKGFKSEQSKRITQWYRDNPEQKTLRSDHMSKSWKQGRIEPNINSINESKLERSLRAMLEAALPELMIQKKTIRVAGKWFYPDVMIEDKYVVEFYGTLWHADPYYYKPDDVIHHRFTATQIWTRDKEREKTLQEAGYNVIVVWQREFVGNEQSVVDRVKSLIENDKGV